MERTKEEARVVLQHWCSDDRRLMAVHIRFTKRSGVFKLIHPTRYHLGSVYAKAFGYRTSENQEVYLPKGGMGFTKIIEHDLHSIGLTNYVIEM